MPTPTKPVSVLQTEKKSHRTKAELSNREKAEKALLSGTIIKEFENVKNNPVAHQEFRRLKKLLRSIQKDDALYSNSINRYCILNSECLHFETLRNRIEIDIDDLNDHCSEFEFPDYIKMKDNLQRNLVNIDKQIQTKRKMMFDIEKENVMTIASSLRSIPKKVETSVNPLKDALKDD